MRSEGTFLSSLQMKKNLRRFYFFFIWRTKFNSFPNYFTSSFLKSTNMLFLNQNLFKLLPFSFPLFLNSLLRKQFLLFTSWKKPLPLTWNYQYGLQSHFQLTKGNTFQCLLNFQKGTLLRSPTFWSLLNCNLPNFTFPVLSFLILLLFLLGLLLNICNNWTKESSNKT